MASGLVLDGQPILGLDGAVGDETAADELFAKLEATYRWGAQITAYLRKVLMVETLHDFLSTFRSEKAWDDFYAADIKQADGNTQVPRGLRSRVSQAHDKIKAAQQTAADLRTKGEEAVEWDKTLKSDEIKAKVQAFWDRHKLMPVLSKMPGDLLISRLTKEIEKRFLHITELLKIKGVLWERRSNTSRQKVGDNLYTDVAPDQQDEVRPETVKAYLEVMEMYMLALAIVGATPVHPSPTAAETKEADPSDYVVFPYQYSIDYLHRANRFVNAALEVHPASRVYTMLQKRDEEERGEWVTKIRTDDKRTIGKIFKEIYHARNEVWRFEADAQARQPGGVAPQGTRKERDLENQIRQLREQNAILKQGRGTKRPPSQTPTSPKGKASKGGAKGGKGGGTGTPVTVDSNQNADSLCGAFNRGGCNQNQCSKNPKELHRCNGKLQATGQACNGTHRSINCNRCVRA